MATNVYTGPPPALPPPRFSRGTVGWLRENLFSSWYNGALTIVSSVIVIAGLWWGLGWVLLEAEWEVISTLGGLMAIGEYNTEKACADQNCFWRPQVSLMLVMVLVGMAWGIAQGGTARRIAIIVAVVLSAFAFLPYSFERMGMDVRLLLLANVPAMGLGWVLGKHTRLGTVRGIVFTGIAAFLIILLLLRGLIDVAGPPPASGFFWAGWRREIAVLLPMLLVGMSMKVSGIAFTNRGVVISRTVVSLIALVVLFVLFLDLRWSGADRGLLVLSNLPAIGIGWAIANYTGLRTIRWLIPTSLLLIPLIYILLYGVPASQITLPSQITLQPVSVIYWGGMMLNLLLAVAGIVLSFPIGIALALGRRSKLPVVKALSVAFIEIFRGVPLITLLFMSSVLVPLAFPEDFPLNRLLRAGIVITLFSAAYTAENIRGGLQALHPGQAEAARALGLPGWQTMMLISLPQAIRNVIPAIVGQFIALFKDTSLVYIIGMLDIVEISRSFIQGNVEYLPSNKELFLFLALSFWVFTYGMSYVSRKVEKHLGVGER